MSLVLYGSFNCPYSFLASLRADRLAAAGDATVQWRAVVHDPAMPPSGREVCGDLADLLDRELEEIRGLLAPGERYPARRPALLADTTAAVAGYSALHEPLAGRLRAALFEALWVGCLRRCGLTALMSGIARCLAGSAAGGLAGRDDAPLGG